MDFRKIIQTFGATVVICGFYGGAIAQQAQFVPIFSLHYTDNAFGGTTSEKIFQNNIEISTPKNRQPTPDTILRIGALWLNAVTADIGTVKFSATPFIWNRHLLRNGKKSDTLGALLGFRLHKSATDQVDLQVTATRLDSNQATGSITNLSTRLKFRRDLEKDQRLDLSLVYGTQSDSEREANVSRAGLEVKYQRDVGKLEFSTKGRLNKRASSIAGQAGTDSGIDVTAAYDVWRGQVYTTLGYNRSEDTTARAGQPKPRNVSTPSIEIGYALPLDASGVGKLVFSAQHEEADSTLGIYNTKTNTLGVSVRLGF